jgi:hypothetical protein
MKWILARFLNRFAGQGKGLCQMAAQTPGKSRLETSKNRRETKIWRRKMQKRRDKIPPFRLFPAA